MARNSKSREFYEKIVDMLNEKASKISLDAEVDIEKSILEDFLQFAEQKLKVSFLYFAWINISQEILLLRVLSIANQN